MLKLQKKEKKEPQVTIMSFQVKEENAMKFREKCKSYDLTASFVLRELVSDFMENYNGEGLEDHKTDPA